MCILNCYSLNWYGIYELVFTILRFTVAAILCLPMSKFHEGNGDFFWVNIYGLLAAHCVASWKYFR